MVNSEKTGYLLLSSATIYRATVNIRKKTTKLKDPTVQLSDTNILF